jgi:ribA/ribD-fused uncharacterized protein
MTDPIDRFWGEYRFLSNFYPAPVEWCGQVYPSVEHAYQAAKCADPDDRAQFLTGTAGEAKKNGQRVKLVKNWEGIKVRIMERLVIRKFEHPDLQILLLATGDAELIEGNTWGDRFWGVCGGTGENHLGRILMYVRKALRDGT